MRAYRKGASSSEGSKKSTFRFHGNSCGLVMKSLVQVCDEFFFGHPRLDGKGSLAGRGNETVGVEPGSNPICEPESAQSRSCHAERIGFAARKLAQPGVHVAADGYGMGVWRELGQEGNATAARGSNPLQGFARYRFVRWKHQHVAGIFSLGDGGKGEAVRLGGHEVFEAVHREIDAAVEECVLDFLHERSLTCNLIEGSVCEAVAGGLHDHQLNAISQSFNPGRHHPGLCEGQLAPASSQPQNPLCHGVFSV